MPKSQIGDGRGMSLHGVGRSENAWQAAPPDTRQRSQEKISGP